MKKFLIPFLLIIVLFVSGCSCASTTIITIDGDVGTKTTFKYDVYLADYNDGISKYVYEQSDKYGKITIKGSYVVDVVKGVNINSLPTEISQEMRDGLSGETIYKQTTKLLLNVDCEKVDNTNSNSDPDTIETISYFYSKNLTPLYSETKSDTTYISLASDVPTLKKIKTADKIVYDTSSYTIVKTVEENTTSEDYEYKKFTVLDNNSLLLAIQNINLSEINDQKMLSAVSSNYGIKQNIQLTYVENIASKNISNTQYSNLKVETFNIVGESSGCLGSNTGKPQVVYLSNNIMVKYVSPLVSSDMNYTSLGALQFDLTE